MKKVILVQPTGAATCVGLLAAPRTYYNGC